MSLRTWREEFYPVSAEDAIKNIPPSKLAEVATEHSLRKWQGLTEENLRKHNLTHEKYRIYESPESQLYIDHDSCALCLGFYEEFYEEPCERCPLFETLGKRCFSQRVKCDDVPYDLFLDEGDARPMISSLEYTLVRIKGT